MEKRGLKWVTWNSKYCLYCLEHQTKEQERVLALRQQQIDPKRWTFYDLEFQECEVLLPFAQTRTSRDKEGEPGMQRYPHWYGSHVDLEEDLSLDFE